MLIDSGRRFACVLRIKHPRDRYLHDRWGCGIRRWIWFSNRCSPEFGRHQPLFQFRFGIARVRDWLDLGLLGRCRALIRQPLQLARGLGRRF